VQNPRQRRQGQTSVPPQPSGIEPQSDAPHVLGTHPQTFGVPPPPQVFGETQS